MFFIINNHRGILSYQIRQLHCRARGASAHMFASTVPHGQFCTWKRDFFFPVIDRLMCTLESSQT